ncbi:MAG: SCO1664 family protein [Nocardioidaceae bacterium]
MAPTDLDVLTNGEVAIRGRLLSASNATFLATVSLDDRSFDCVYKPTAGERPLWDFPDGTLAWREAAAYAVSQALGWGVVPPTVLRGGPFGDGMVQAWREPDPDQDPVDIVAKGREPAGYLHVLDALDDAERPISVVHEDSVPLRRMAVFDALVNNADRKGGHILPMGDGHRFGVDHGVCFHVDDKLRTVLWGWAGEPLDGSDRAALNALLDDDLASVVGDLLNAHEVEALRLRGEALLTAGSMPLPSSGWRAIPWPVF